MNWLLRWYLQTFHVYNQVYSWKQQYFIRFHIYIYIGFYVILYLWYGEFVSWLIIKLLITSLVSSNSSWNSSFTHDIIHSLTIRQVSTEQSWFLCGHRVMAKQHLHWTVTWDHCHVTRNMVSSDIPHHDISVKGGKRRCELIQIVFHPKIAIYKRHDNLSLCCFVKMPYNSCISSYVFFTWNCCWWRQHTCTLMHISCILFSYWCIMRAINNKTTVNFWEKNNAAIYFCSSSDD
jgi:hypothetical protein